VEKIIITKDIVLGASDYITYELKEEWVGNTAPKCFDKLSITNDGEPVPPMYMVNIGLKNRYLMVLLAGMLHMEYESEEEDTTLMTVDCYNRWAGSHVMNQLDRLKRDTEVRDKVYDLLYDFREAEKMLSAQIYGLLAVQNDSVIRQSEMMATSIKELPQIMEQLKELQEGVTADAE
jgi:hypothetical protein